MLCHCGRDLRVLLEGGLGRATVVIYHGLGCPLDSILPQGHRRGSREGAVYAGNLPDLPTHLAHDAGPRPRAGPAAPREVEGAAGAVPVAGAPWADASLSGEQAAFDNLARVLGLLLLDAGQGIPEVVLALLDGAVVIPLVLLPDPVPLAGVLGLVGLGPELDWEVLLYELEPQLAGAALDMGRVELYAAELPRILDPDEDVSDILVWEEVADAFEMADILYAGCRRQVNERSDRHRLRRLLVSDVTGVEGWSGPLPR